MNRPWTGEYIVTEGTDATGKTSVANGIAKLAFEEGYEVIRVDEPDSAYVYHPDSVSPEPLSPIAAEIRRVIKDGSLGRAAITNIHLFTAARAENWHTILLPALERGAIVSAARNHYSTEIYQGVAEGSDRELIRTITRLSVGEAYMNPDHFTILDLDDEEERARRIANRGPLDTPDTFESRDQAFQQALLDGYRTVAREEGIDIVVANRPPEEISLGLWNDVKARIASRS